jgi:hypothetical protein
MLYIFQDLQILLDAAAILMGDKGKSNSYNLRHLTPSISRNVGIDMYQGCLTDPAESSNKHSLMWTWFERPL